MSSHRKAWKLMRLLKLHAKLFLLVITLAVLSGCATDQDSDIPWNNPQPWEGSPTIPGMPSYQ